jgi:hypothetical protein
MKLINQVKKVPAELLSENSGYNPEEAENHGEVQLADDGGSIAVEDEEGDIRHYSLVGAIDLLDYINHYPQQFGLFYKGKFYVSN